MSLSGLFDKETGRVLLEIDTADPEEITEAVRWLRSVQSWHHRREVKRNGGRRWEFERNAEGVKAVWCEGLCRRWPVKLRPFTVRKVRECDSCKRTMEPVDAAWRQAPGEYGYSKARFCDHCIERGSKPVPPELKLIAGGIS